ncbi:MAG: hypothetical protein CME06_18400 [Gemmatimonadetes bacterium]|nr:hypothetical protein [Gemmatimonadota bacterium]
MNSRLSILPFALAASAAFAVEGAGRYNVLQIVVDTVRADHLGIYGYPRDTTPFLDAKATEGIVWDQHSSNATWTVPSTIAIMTSLVPQTHRVITPALALKEEWTTLAELVKPLGYRTGLFSVNRILLTGDRHFDQGFDHTSMLHRPDASATDEFFAWLDSTGTAPFYTHIQYYGGHAPYTPSEPFDSLFVGDAHYGTLGDAPRINPAGCKGGIDAAAAVDSILDMDYYVAQYDALIAEDDHEIERLFEGIEARGLADSTLVLFTADHGELMAGEHDYYFCHVTFYEGNSHVPLVIWLPEAWQASHGPLRGFSLDGRTSHIDLLPTIAELLGVDPPPQAQGTSLSIEPRPPTMLGSDANQRMLKHKAYKMVHFGTELDPEARVALFDLVSDPGEEINIAKRDSSITAAFTGALLQHSAAAENQYLPSPPGIYFSDDFSSLDSSLAEEGNYFVGEPYPNIFGWEPYLEPDTANTVMRGFLVDTTAVAPAAWVTGSCAVIEVPEHSYRTTMRVQLREGVTELLWSFTSFAGTGYRLVLQENHLSLYTRISHADTLLVEADVDLPLESWRDLSTVSTQGNLVVELGGVPVLSAFEPRWELIYGSTEFRLGMGGEVWIDDLVMER